MSNAIGKKILLFGLGGVAFSVAFFAVQYAKEIFIDKPRLESLEQEIKRQGQDKGGARPPSVANAEAAKNIANGTLDGLAPDSRDKFEYANGVFWGFYWVNTRSRDKWCRRYGVELRNFTQAFKDKNSSSILAALKVSKQYNFDNEKNYLVIADALDRAVDQDMRDLMASSKLNEKQACEFLEVLADVAVTNLDFSKSFPSGYATLMAE